MQSKHPLEGLKGQANYKGCLINKMIGPGYRVFGIYCETPEDVDFLISQSCKVIEGSIEKGKSVTISNASGAFTALNSKNDI